jgi:uncharacterized membrane protein
MPMPMYSYPGMSGGWMTAWMIISSLFWLGLAAVIVWALVRLASRAGRGTNFSGSASQPSAADIIKARYARGEIDGAAFREMMGQLAASDEGVASARSV